MCAGVQLRLPALGRYGRREREMCAGVQLRLQALGRYGRREREMCAGVQLRLQALGNTTGGGLAGRSRACKHCSGLALPRAGGEHHRARGVGASNKAREGGGFHTPRAGWKTGRFRRLDGGCYWDKRERERERDASAMLRHLPTGVQLRTPTPVTSVPEENTRKQPLICDSEPSPKGLAAKALAIDPETDPNPIYLVASPSGEAMNIREHSVNRSPCQE
jgi:hypothetical protein